MNNRPPESRPIWAPEAALRAFWVAVGESPQWIAQRTDHLLRVLGSVFGVTSWKTTEGQQWPGPLDESTAIVQDSAVRSSTGETQPDGGYTFAVYGAGTGVFVQVRVSAGASTPGTRLPLHSVSVKLQETAGGSISSETADVVCAAVAEIWQPAVVEFGDLEVRRATRRGKWKIGVGYRTWISDAVGSVAEHAEGLTVRESWGGTLISAPDNWPAEAVRDAVLATLHANGLDEVEH